jgi:large subunit ribosomal protein L3
MAGFILGNKGKQSQIFDEKGERIPTTFIKTSPCFLVDIKTQDKHGYQSMILGFGQTKNISKPTQGKLTKAGIKTPLRFLREFRLDKVIAKIDLSKISAGTEIKPALFFKTGDLVEVSGTSKGKGFQGVVKRHHFMGGSRTHGQSRDERAPGSIGSTTTPGRINKGKRMAGHMGHERKTIKNLKVIEVKDDGLVIKGLVPGGKNGLLEVRCYQ